MAHRFKNIDRNTPMLLPPDLRDWVAEDDLLHFVIGAVERLPLLAFAVNHKACGDEQFPPQMIVPPTGSSAAGASSGPLTATWARPPAGFPAMGAVKCDG